MSGPVVISGILVQPLVRERRPGSRNGSRGALKMRCPRGRAGSSPAPGTDIAAPPECKDDHAGGAIGRRSVRLGQRRVDELDEEVCGMTYNEEAEVGAGPRGGSGRGGERHLGV